MYCSYIYRPIPPQDATISYSFSKLFLFPAAIARLEVVAVVSAADNKGREGIRGRVKKKCVCVREMERYYMYYSMYYMCLLMCV